MNWNIVAIFIPLEAELEASCLGSALGGGGGVGGGGGSTNYSLCLRAVPKRLPFTCRTVSGLTSARSTGWCVS